MQVASLAGERREFADRDRLLVTADGDNRVVLRPRTESGFVAAVRRIALPPGEIRSGMAEVLTAEQMELFDDMLPIPSALAAAQGLLVAAGN